MIFELSKNKSLLYVLSKVELDEETTELVKVKAPISDIKKSLENNITSSNLIQYRKYILKATKEEKEAEKDRLLSEEEDYKITDDSSRREARVVSGEIESKASEEKRREDVYKDLSVLQNQVSDLEKISKTARVTPDKTVIGAGKTYRRFGNKKGTSNKLLGTLNSLKDNNNILIKLYSDVLSDGVFFSTSKKDDIDVKKLQDRINKLLNSSFPIADSNETMPFYEVILKLHSQKHGYEPKATRDDSKRGRELRNVMARLQGKNPKIDNEYDRANKTYKTMIAEIQSIKNEKDRIVDRIQELEEVEKNTDKIIENKLRKLVIGLKAVISHSKPETAPPEKKPDPKDYQDTESGRAEYERKYLRWRDSRRLNPIASKPIQAVGPSALSPEFIKEKTQAIKDIQDNPEKYLEEGRQELGEDIEVEKVKLEKLVKDLEVFDRLKEPLSEYNKILRRYLSNKKDLLARESRKPIYVIKEKLTESIGLIIKMRRKVKKIIRLSSGASDSIEQGLADTLLGSEGAKLTIEADGLNFFGLPTIDTDKMTRIDNLTDEYEQLVEELQEIVNEINHMIDGSGKQ
tara:strand:+ start:6227 stop:7951 length:1725 start_codon:yes stop_codon:yes gene_type:complete